MLPDLLGNSVIVAMDIAMSIAFLPSANADEIVLMAPSAAYQMIQPRLTLAAH